MYAVAARAPADRRSAIEAVLLLLGFSAASALTLVGLAELGRRIDDAVAAWLETERSIEREIAALEARLEERRARLSEVRGERQLMIEAQAEVEAEMVVAQIEDQSEGQ